jgi:hypothetical protein
MDMLEWLENPPLTILPSMPQTILFNKMVRSVSSPFGKQGYLTNLLGASQLNQVSNEYCTTNALTEKKKKHSFPL